MPIVSANPEVSFKNGFSLLFMSCRTLTVELCLLLLLLLERVMEDTTA